MKTHFLFQPHRKMSIECLTKEILSLHNSLQLVPICCGIFEERWVSVFEQYNHKNKYKDGKAMFYIDEAHTLHHPKNRFTAIYKTIWSANFSGSKCQFVLPATLTRNTQVRCVPCKQLGRQCLQTFLYKQPSPFCALDNKPDFTGSATAYLSVSEKGRIHKTVKEN